MTPNELYQNITEILVLSQFEHWVEPECNNPTAEQVNTKRQRAFDYYLGRTEKKPEELLVTNKFHVIIKQQVGLIMREIEKYRPYGA